MPHDSTHCPICQGRTNGRMSDTQFGEFLHDCKAEWERKQSVFAATVENQRYTYDIDAGTLTVGNVTREIVVIGTYCVSRGTWLWGWANDSYSLAARNRSAALKDLRHFTGFQVFEDEGLKATSADAVDLVAVAIHFLNAAGTWREDFPDLQVFLAVDPSGPV